jgi:metallo-beta-lactamase class B
MKSKIRFLLVIAQCVLSSMALSVDHSVPANWLASTKPFRIGGPIYYVGTQGLGVYLIKSDSGLVLLSGAMPPSTALIRKSIETLGFKLRDIRLLLVSHAHIDHVGTLCDFKKMTGGSIVAMAAEADLLKSGGKTDYLFGKRPNFYFAPVIPDRLIKDGETVTLGNLHLTAHWTPGHTKGCTTWEMAIEEAGRKYNVVFLDGTGINPGTRFKRASSYPGIESDYRRTFETLKSLHPDVFLAYHVEAFNFDTKRYRAEKEGVEAWVDPAGYESWVTQSKQRFEKMFNDEN